VKIGDYPLTHILKISGLILASLAMLLIWQVAEAHAFPDHSSPQVGSELPSPPSTVRIWFDGDIEPVFSTLIVKTAAGTQVSEGQGRVSGADSTLLEAVLPHSLPPGSYYVYWSVIARDGHHTAGRFPFSIK